MPCPKETRDFILEKEEGAAEVAKDFGYRSFIGMLLYIANTTRPDIKFAVTFLAKYTHRFDEKFYSPILLGHYFYYLS